MIPTDIGASIIAAPSLPPQAASAGALTTAVGVDRDAVSGRKFLSGLFAVHVGAVAGAPTSFTVDAKLQDSADNATFADALVNGVAPAMTTVTAAGMGTKKFDASGLRRYLRVLVTVGFVGGTSPTVQVQAALVLGGIDLMPSATT